MKIQRSCRIELDYTIVDDEGEIVESSDESGPLEFVQGAGEIPDALARALEGKQVGDEVEVTFGPGEAFGEYNPDGIVSVPRGDFPEDVELAPGEWIAVSIEDDQAEDDEFEELDMLVIEVGDDAVVLDANHPLANESVTFRVQVRSVSEG